MKNHQQQNCMVVFLHALREKQHVYYNRKLTARNCTRSIFAKQPRFVLLIPASVCQKQPVFASPSQKRQSLPLYCTKNRRKNAKSRLRHITARFRRFGCFVTKHKGMFVFARHTLNGEAVFSGHCFENGKAA